MRTTTWAGLLLFTLLGAAAGCGGSDKPAEDPSKAKADAVDPPTGGDAPTDKAGGGTPAKTAGDAPKKDICTGQDLNNLEELLNKSECEVADKKPESLENPDMKGKLEVTVGASPTKVAPGGKVDLLVTFANKTKEPMALHFRIDPLARFETEAFDAKKKRADVPATPPPPPPKGHSAPPPADQKVAKVTVGAGGKAIVRVPWDAVKMKWAPEKVRGTASEKGYPRVPNGPLAKGKYNVRVLTPLVGVFEGADHEVSGPKVDIEVGN